MGWALALHGGAGDIPLAAAGAPGSPPHHAPPLPRHRHGRAPRRAPRARRCRARREGAGGLPALQRRQGLRANRGRHRRDGGLRHGGRHPALRRRLRPLHRRQRRLARQARHGRDAAHLPRLRRRRGLRQGAACQGLETKDPSHFITENNIERLRQAKEANRVQIDYTQPMKKTVAPADDNSQIGTVGCVVIDAAGNLATAISTGGLVNEMVGRIGDTPLVGAGTYANALCAVSATGKGETIIRHTVARDVAALTEHRGLPLREAAAHVVGAMPCGDVSASGEVCMVHNTTGMFRACATEGGHAEVGIWTNADADGQNWAMKVAWSILSIIIVHSRDIVSCV